MKRPRVIAHLDCDCFYAQVELVRLALPLDTPLCVVQWGSALAVSYAARPFGIKRGENIADIARKSAGKVRVVHVQTIGNTRPPQPGPQLTHSATNNDGGGGGGACDAEQAQLAHPTAETPGTTTGEASGDTKNTQKVSLARYRNASSQVFSVIASLLPNAPFERASIDEAFIDITAHVEARLSSSSPATDLPDDTHVLGPGSRPSADVRVPMLREGARLIHAVRTAVYEKTGFTISGGIAHNKMLAKYASACNKPNQQTVVFPEGVDQLLGHVPLTAFRGLGGQMGNIVTAAGYRTAKDVRDNMSLAEITKLVGPRFGAFVHAACRGEDDSEVICRREANTVLAAKTFQPTSSLPTAVSWLKVLADEVADRLAYQQTHHRRYASTLVCSFRVQSTKSSSTVSLNRSGPMPSENVEDRPAAILDAAKRTLSKVLAGNEYGFPITFCGLTGANFVARAQGRLSIAQFCQKGGERDTVGGATVLAPVTPVNLSGKKRKRDSIGLYFRKQEGAPDVDGRSLDVACAKSQGAAFGATASAMDVTESDGQVDVVARRVQIRNDFALAKKLSEEDWAERRRGNKR